MSLLRDVFITGTGAFLPGQPVGTVLRYYIDAATKG